MQPRKLCCPMKNAGDHLQTVLENRRRGAKKAAATRKAKLSQAGDKSSKTPKSGCVSQATAQCSGSHRSQVKSVYKFVCVHVHVYSIHADSRLSYLDLEVSISDRRYTTAVFDKRDSFNFHIVNFPHMDGNIPSGPAYGVYVSQLVRIGRICDSCNSFFTRHHHLTCRLVKQGFLYDKLVTSFKGFCSKYPEIFSKFKVSIRQHVEDGICLPTVAINRLSNRVSIR